MSFRSITFASLLLLVPAGLPIAGTAQQKLDQQKPQSSSSSPHNPAGDKSTQPASHLGIGVAGSGIALEPSEALFDVAAGLNSCGYDADLEESAPVRQAIRADINAAIAASESARASRDVLCDYVRAHAAGEGNRNLTQYVSLAVYLSPPPQLTPIVDISELPTEAAQVAEVLPLLRTFSEQTQLHLIYIKHRSEYEDLITRLNGPLAKIILDSNIYLKIPNSSYEDRRFLVLLEPLLSPNAANARIYANDYVVVVSPRGNPLGQVQMDTVRHTYLHFIVEPMLYTHPQAMVRLDPILKSVANAPLDFVYKNDTATLVTECLIKAIEARTLETSVPHPAKPARGAERTEQAAYDAAMVEYNRKVDTVRRDLVLRDMRLGYIVTGYFYDSLTAIDKEGVGLKDNIGEIVYAMDVQRELGKASKIAFYPEGTREVLARGPAPQPKGLDLAELKLIKGDMDGASDIADAALKADPNDPRAHFLQARLDIMARLPEDATEHLQQTLKLSRDPHTIAWAHIYMGRLYDIQHTPDRPKAVAEYKAALAIHDGRPDTRIAAEQGLKQPFALPQRERATPDEDAPIDPTGKAEKDAYKPPPPKN